MTDIPPLSHSIHPDPEGRKNVNAPIPPPGMVQAGPLERAPKDGIFFTGVAEVKGLYATNDDGIYLYLIMEGHRTPERCSCGKFHKPINQTFDVFLDIHAASQLSLVIGAHGPALRQAFEPSWDPTKDKTAREHVIDDLTTLAWEALQGFVESMKTERASSTEEAAPDKEVNEHE